jgi:hypothetical protein
LTAIKILVFIFTSPGKYMALAKFFLAPSLARRLVAPKRSGGGSRLAGHGSPVTARRSRLAGHGSPL